MKQLETHEQRTRDEASSGQNGRPRSMHLPPPNFPPPPPPLESVEAAGEDALAEATEAMKALRAPPNDVRDSPSPPPLPQPDAFNRTHETEKTNDLSREEQPVGEDGQGLRFRSEDRRTKPGGENHYASVAVRPTPGHPLPNAAPNPAPARVQCNEDPGVRDAGAVPNSPQSRYMTIKMLNFPQIVAFCDVSCFHL